MPTVAPSATIVRNDVLVSSTGELLKAESIEDPHDIGSGAYRTINRSSVGSISGDKTVGEPNMAPIQRPLLALLPQLLLAAAILGGLPACSIGPSAIRTNHLNYNDAVISATSEELLLNIVRMRYNDPTQWMSISSINSSFEVELGIGGQGGVSGATVSGSGVGNLGYRDAPTITFAPRQGEQLAQQMLMPVSVTNVGYLSNAGWPFSWVALLLIENIQGIGSFDISTHYPIRGQTAEFLRTIDLIDELESQDKIVVGFLKYHDPWNDAPVPGSTVTAQSYIASAETGNVFVTEDGGKTFDYSTNDNEPMLILRRSAREEPDMKELTALLDLEYNKDSFMFARATTIEQPPKPSSSLYIRTRSFSSVLRLLSHGVDVPPKDIQAGICTKSIAGSPEYLIEKQVRDGFNVKVSKKQPTTASVAVPYRGMWFYIDDANHNSKQTFMLLSELFNLQISAGTQNTGPVLTIPVS